MLRYDNYLISGSRSIRLFILKMFCERKDHTLISFVPPSLYAALFVEKTALTADCLEKPTGFKL